MPIIVKFDPNVTQPQAAVIPDASLRNDGVMTKVQAAQLAILVAGGGGELPGVLVATQFPGADLGAKINAADAFSAGVGVTLYVPPGNYAIDTPVSISTGHRLLLGNGAYATSGLPAGTGIAVFTLADNCVLEGQGWGTIVDEPANYVVAIPLSAFTPGSDGTKGLIIRNFRINGLPSGPTAPSQANIPLDNAQNAQVTNIWFDHSRGYGVETGGDSSFGKHGNNVWVTDCFFDHVQGTVLSAVNSENFHFDRNTFFGCGAADAFGVPIDLEPNSGTDIIRNFTINNNILDLTDIGAGGAGPQIQGAVDGEFVGNTIFCGTVPNPAITFVLAGTGSTDIIIADNVFKGYAFEGIRLAGCLRWSITSNTFINLGGQTSALPPPVLLPSSIDLENSTMYCTISDNYFSAPDLGNSAIQEVSASDFNKIFNNVFDPGNNGSVATQPYVYLTGASTRAWDNNFNGVRQSGAQERSRRFASANTATAPQDDTIGVDSAGGTVTVTLPNPSLYIAPPTGAVIYDDSATVRTTVGTRYLVIQDEGGAAAAFNISVSPFGAEKINGVAAPFVVNTNYQRVTLYTNGVDWFLA